MRRAAVLLVFAAAACGPSPTPSAGSPPPHAGDDGLRAEIAAKDAEIERLRAQLAELADVEPVAAIVHSIRDIPWKLRAASRLTDAQRAQFAVELGRDLSLRPDRVPDVVRALREVEDRASLRLLADAIRSGAVASARTADKAALADLVRSGEPAERRIGAVWAMQSGAEPTPPEGRAAAIERLRWEEDPEVIGALAEIAGDAPDAIAALRAAAVRMPPGDDRRRVLTPIARGSLLRDRGESAIGQITETQRGALRDDLAAALARAANAMSASLRRSEPVDERAARMQAARERFLAVYQGTGDVVVRIDLVRAAAAGLGVMPTAGVTPAERSSFYAAVAEAESDAGVRARLSRLAAGFADGSLEPTSSAVESILSGR